MSADKHEMQLDSLLASSHPEIRDDKFTEKTMSRIKHEHYSRRWIIRMALIAASIFSISIIPYDILIELIDSPTETDMMHLASATLGVCIPVVALWVMGEK
jgi:hypothetical protein